MSYPDIFSYHSCPVSMCTQIVRPNIYRAGLSKDLRPGWEASVDTLYCKTFSDSS